jgi:Ca2+-binding EF-hand superfamily protein
LLAEVYEMFLEADTDLSGGLDKAELAGVLKKIYKSQGVSRSAKKTAQELDTAMAAFDLDGNGE